MMMMMMSDVKASASENENAKRRRREKTTPPPPPPLPEASDGNRGRRAPFAPIGSPQSSLSQYAIGTQTAFHNQKCH